MDPVEKEVGTCVWRCAVTVVSVDAVHTAAVAHCLPMSARSASCLVGSYQLSYTAMCA
jgi:hypothetical protein